MLLGPGRYTEVTTIKSGSSTFWIHAYATVDDLAFRGVDRDAGIIGPESGPPDIGERGFAVDGAQTITIENMTSNCHILRFGSRPSVWTQFGQGIGHIFDLRNNYWGTNDPAEIAESIIDHEDGAQLTGTVLFEPFLTAPVGTRSRSFGRLKSLYSLPD